VSDDGARRKPIEHSVPKDSTVKQLYATALWCGKPGCLQFLYRVSDTGERVLNSEVAHIHARRVGGPRWNPTMSEADNRSYDNLIVLCEAHATEIDKTPEHYPPELLHGWKQEQLRAHERAAAALPPLTDVEVGEVMQRSFGLTDVVAAVVGQMALNPRMRTRDEALDRAGRLSYARRIRRLRAVPAERRDAVLIWMSEQNDPVLAVPEGQIRVLLGRLGSGKTERALRWWDDGLLAAQADPEVEIPIWLDARDITGGLEMAITASLGCDPLRPCRIVIDNLDGVSPRQARQLLDQARELVTAWPTVSVLATSRPGVPVSDDELIKVEPWSVERGADLVRTVAGDVLWQVWAAETKDLLTTPLTAIAVAARLRAGRDTRVSRLTLLNDLARIILEEERPEQATQQIWDEFARLAVRILTNSAPVTAASFGSPPMVWKLTDTGLIVSDDGKLSFALPVFEQHFGAQAIQNGLAEPEVAAATEAFPRWRYALASAIATSEVVQAETYALRVARVNPAALSWILDEITAEHGDTASDTEAAPSRPAPIKNDKDADPMMAQGAWLRDGLQALLDGFGACRTSLARYRDGQLVQWGVQSAGDYRFLGIARDELPPPAVVRVADNALDVTISSGWISWTPFRFPSENLGRWFWARQSIRNTLLRLIRRRRLPLPADSPLVRERMWVLAQRIMHIRRQPWSTVIPLDDLRHAVDGLMEQVERTVHSRWQCPDEEIDSHDVRWIHAQLQHETAEALASPQPPRDRTNRPAKWRWDGYSPELTLDIHRNVLSDALIGYRDIVEHNFARFGPALGLYGVLPVRIKGTIFTDDDGADNPQSSLLYEISANPNAQRASNPDVDLELLTQAEIPQYYAKTAANPPRGGLRASITEEDGPQTRFYVPTKYDTDLLTGLSRPATNLAYEWLADDLQALGWLTQKVKFHN
jgi:hypothetical protein